jgi:hypothetical protein
MRKVCLTTVLALLLLAPAGAVGQQGGSNPFGPLPQNQPSPQEAPEPQPADPDSGDDDGLGGTAFWLIIGTTGALFAGIAIFITRDMRRSAGTKRKSRRTRGTGKPGAEADPAAARHTPGSQRAKAKAQQRAKTKAARKQRRKSRSR